MQKILFQRQMLSMAWSRQSRDRQLCKTLELVTMNLMQIYQKKYKDASRLGRIQRYFKTRKEDASRRKIILTALFLETTFIQDCSYKSVLVDDEVTDAGYQMLNKRLADIQLAAATTTTTTTTV